MANRIVVHFDSAQRIKGIASDEPVDIYYALEGDGRVMRVWKIDDADVLKIGPERFLALMGGEESKDG